MKINKNQQNGFTIVELLIVVVVIAILAAITIVSFNGIQTRAKNAQQVSAVNEYAKGLRAYQAANGGMPWYGVACFDGTDCWSGTSTTAAAASMRADLKTVMGQTLPTISTPYAALLANATTTDVPNGGNYSGYYILYQHSDTGSCIPIGGARYLNGAGSSGGIRTCRAAIE